MLILSVACWAILGSVDPTAEASKLEAKAIEGRLRIKSGLFEVSVEGWEAKAEKRIVFKSKSRIVLDGVSLLNDVTYFGPENVRKLHSWGPSMVVFYSDQKDSQGVKSGANLTDTESASRRARQTQVDPRLLGFCPANFLNLWQVDLKPGILSQTTKHIISVQDVVLDGQDCAKISRELLNGVLVDTWIDKKRDWSVIKIEVVSSKPLIPKISVYRTDLEYFPGAKRYFPVRTTLETKRDGVEVGWEEVTIDVKGLNQPVDQPLFEPEAMNIPPGTPVSAMGKLSRIGMSQWDGKEIAPLNLISPPPHVPIRQVVLYGAAAILGLSAALVVWKGLSAKSRLT